MSGVLEFTVYGVAQPQGSARQVPVPGYDRPLITSDNKNLKGWRKTISDSALAEIQRRKVRATPFALITDGPIAIVAVFYLPRPKYIKSKRVPHVVKPDLDKLVRGAGDALTGIAWRDDSQITDILTRKRYTDPSQQPRANFIISTLSEV